MDEMWMNPAATFSDALKTARDPAALVLRLLEAAFPGTISATKQNGDWVFDVKPTPKWVAETFQLSPDGTLSGRIEVLSRVYLAIREVETTLDEAVFLSPEMRKERMALVSSQLGLSAEELAAILRHWRKS